jgi:hypothetical protein
MRRLLVALAALIAVSGCGTTPVTTSAPGSVALATASPSPEGSGSSAVQHVACGRLDPAPCREVLAAVVARFPEVARASLVVVDLGKDPAALDPGPDRYLVTYVPTDSTDLWMWPPTFQVERGPAGLTVSPWNAEVPLPAFFTKLLEASGVDASMIQPTPTTAPSPSPIATPTPSLSAALITESIGRLTVTHPVAWRLVPGPVAVPERPVPLFYLSDAPLAVGPCPTPDPTSGEFRACPPPLTALPPDGVLITFDPNLGLAELVPPRVDVVAVEGACRSIGADAEMRSVAGGTVVTACLSGPDLAALEAGVRVVVDSLNPTS